MREGSPIGRSREIARQVSGAVDLSPRTASGAGRPASVWYAAYGSNLSRERFMAYVAGGRPPGGRRLYAGARDRSAPVGDRPARFDRDIFFAGSARTWGGGSVAFLADAPGAALGRIYLITSEQFDDVVVQENGGEPPGPALDLAAAMHQGHAAAGPGAYDRLVCLGEADGAPVITFTTTRYRPGGSTMRPSGAYLATISRGLTESFGLELTDAVHYLRGFPGADAWDPLELEAAVLAEWGRWSGC